MKKSVVALCSLLASSGVSSQSVLPGEWIQLFNGHDLEGWTPKFTGFPLGVNHLNTFRVEDGLFKVSYDNWSHFSNEFGHIFYQQPFSHYLLRVEYRFIGEQVKNGPGWAFRNNGIMFHSQPPESMALDQEFPTSIEAQMLGGNGRDKRPTANVCSPGTHYEIDGELITVHCTDSVSETYHGDQWVVMELEVRGSQFVRHLVNGDTVFEYSQVQLDPSDPAAQRLIQDGASILVDSGYISVQAESHPLEIRTLELMPLDQ